MVAKKEKIYICREYCIRKYSHSVSFQFPYPTASDFTYLITPDEMPILKNFFEIRLKLVA